MGTLLKDIIKQYRSQQPILLSSPVNTWDGEDDILVVKPGSSKVLTKSEVEPYIKLAVEQPVLFKGWAIEYQAASFLNHEIGLGPDNLRKGGIIVYYTSGLPWVCVDNLLPPSSEGLWFIQEVPDVKTSLMKGD